jgi:hypothetical protein
MSPNYYTFVVFLASRVIPEVDGAVLVSYGTIPLADRVVPVAD